ncbi:MAG TPA: transcriptional regulator NrdR [Spirochaetota bacterium]|nr:transcriptional regulator NrdR [Spirochaetota bacterium]HOL56494.1 transcriptional regulator NrdR [Spirochaetota bacterium]HPP03931.1 transcriptional regulator NrdR [Spirochaetota bacterium]
MKCPFCGFIEDKVIETRESPDGTNIRRRRECLKCGFRFTSYEQIKEKPLMVIKKDKRREIFSIEKLSSGIYKAIEKRAIPQKKVEELVNSIEKEAMLKAGEDMEITSEKIGEMVMEKLKELDKVAYIRFASVYRKFEDVGEFIEEIEKIN